MFVLFLHKLNPDKGHTNNLHNLMLIELMFHVIKCLSYEEENAYYHILILEKSDLFVVICWYFFKS